MYEPFTEQPIQLVGEDGQNIGRWSSDLTEAELRTLHRHMLRARVFDEKLVTILRQGKTSFYAQSSGMEATQVGIAAGVRPGHDWIWPYYRDQALALALGVPVLDLIAQCLGSNLDASKGRQMPHHFAAPGQHFVSISSSIANQVPPAVGTAMAQQYLGTDEITVCTFGDGATSEGDWHAGLNMAGVSRAPCLFICENNQWAISVGFKGQTAAENIHVKARAYGMPGYYVDGQDVLAVRAVVRQVAEQVRAGQGPALIECLTYRVGTHSSSDDDSRYRSKEEVDAWRGRDPIRRFERYLEAEGLPISADERSQMQQEIGREIDAAINQADAAGFPDWRSMFDDVYQDLPVHLREQAAFVRAEQEGAR